MHGSGNVIYTNPDGTTVIIGTATHYDDGTTSIGGGSWGAGALGGVRGGGGGGRGGKAPAASAQKAAATPAKKAKPVRFCLDAACTMVANLPALQPPPINWAKSAMYLACLAGAPPELMQAALSGAQDSTDTVPETQGPTTYWGFRPGQRNGGQQPLNPSSAPELGGAAANAPAMINNQLSCSAIVANANVN